MTWTTSMIWNSNLIKNNHFHIENNFYACLFRPLQEWYHNDEDSFSTIKSALNFCVKPTVSQTFYKLYTIVLGVAFFQLLIKKSKYG